jgi:hypothetical protein
MDLEQSCREGRIRIREFFEFVAGRRAYRTHLLDVGDCVVSPCFGREDVLALERISGLDSPEKGDFVTEGGITGPIRGNVFVKIKKGHFPEYLLIEGDGVGEPHCPVPAYDLVRKYVEERCRKQH